MSRCGSHLPAVPGVFVNVAWLFSYSLPHSETREFFADRRERVKNFKLHNPNSRKTSWNGRPKAHSRDWKKTTTTQRGKAWQSRNPNNSTTDFTDFTDKKNPFPIREIREIRGKKSSRK
jgi:hypothetical protein